MGGAIAPLMGHWCGAASEPAAARAAATAGRAAAADPLRQAWPAALHQPSRLRTGASSGRCAASGSRWRSAPVSAHIPSCPTPGRRPTGVASEAEYLEIGLAERRDPVEVRAALDAALPAGIDILEVVEASARGGSLARRADRGVVLADPAPRRRTGGGRAGGRAAAGADRALPSSGPPRTASGPSTPGRRSRSAASLTARRVATACPTSGHVRHLTWLFGMQHPLFDPTTS